VVGQRELADESVAVRHRTVGDQGKMTIEQFVDGLVAEIHSKGKSPLCEGHGP